jgi:hypothetical protein
MLRAFFPVGLRMQSAHGRVDEAVLVYAAVADLHARIELRPVKPPRVARVLAQILTLIWSAFDGLDPSAALPDHGVVT